MEIMDSIVETMKSELPVAHPHRTLLNEPRILRIPAFLLSAVLLAVAVMILQADVWMNDEEIVGQWASATPGGNWLPAQLWLISKGLCGGAVWAYRVWNVLALWFLSWTVFRIATQFQTRSTDLDFAAKQRVAWTAALLVAAHPLAGTSACQIGNLGWQLAVLFGLTVVQGFWGFLRQPTALRMGLLMLWLLLAAVSAPAGMLLGLGGLWVVWRLATTAERDALGGWFSAKTGWGTGLGIAALAQVLVLGAFLQQAWQHRSIAQGGAWTEHWLTQGRVVWQQLRSFFLPTRLLPEHQFAWSTQWNDWPAVLALALVLSTTGWCVWRLSRDRLPQPLRALLLLALWPTVLVFGWRTTHLLSEVRWYAVLPWVAILMAWGLGWLLQRWPAMQWPLGWGLPMGLLFLSVDQMTRFSDSREMAAYLLKLEPNQVRVRSYLQEKQVLGGQLAAVLSSSTPFANAYQSMQAENAASPFGRRYDLVHTLRWWVMSERRAQSALEQNYGPEYAQAFAQTSTARFIQEVQELARTEPAALPLLAALSSPLPALEPAKPRPMPSIPGIPAATADLTH